jgi:hypothetical protein
MARTYESIATTTASGASSTINFTSFPSTYTDLVIVCAIKGTNANDAYLRYNSDTSTNYSDTRMRGNGVSVDSVRSSSAAGIDLGGISNIGGTDVATLLIQIFNYNSTSYFKTNLTRFSNGSTQSFLNVGLWRSTAAITSIDLFNRGGSWVSGSTFSLYGIEAA